jgi:dTDP-4-amino-4,6-dideoxygalactose transaminase
MQFTDLKTQYAALKTSIDARIQRVLDHGQYIMGPEVKELEARWPPSPARSTASPWPAAPRRC